MNKNNSQRSQGFNVIASSWILSLFLLFSFWHDARAQQQFGAFYQPADEITQFNQDLNDIADAGFQRIVFTGKLNRNQVSVLDTFDLEIIQDLGLHYETSSTIRERDLQNIIGEVLFDYFDTETIPESLLLLSYSTFNKSSFTRQLNRTLESVSGADFTALRTHRQSVSPALNIRNWIIQVSSYNDIQGFSADETTSGFLYQPKDDAFDIRDFQNIIRYVRSSGNMHLYVDWEWVFQSDPLLTEVIQSYSSDPDAVFPNPAEEYSIDGNTFLSIIFLLIWFSFAGHVLVNPAYLPGLARYVQTHNFFMTDILERRIRFGAGPNIYVLMQWTILGGLMTYLFSFERLSSTGLDAICTNLGLLETPSAFLAFLSGAIIVLLINLFYMCWIYFSHSEINHFSQSAVFQFWPQHVLLFIGSAVILMVITNAGSLMVDLSILLFFIVVIFSFLFAVSDLVRFARTNLSFYLTSSAMFIILIFLILYLSFAGSNAFEVLQLARSL